jgi:hypothetical protein
MVCALQTLPPAVFGSLPANEDGEGVALLETPGTLKEAKTEEALQRETVISS